MLPATPEAAVNGTELLGLVRPKLTGSYTDTTTPSAASLGAAARLGGELEPLLFRTSESLYLLELAGDLVLDQRKKNRAVVFEDYLAHLPPGDGSQLVTPAVLLGGDCYGSSSWEAVVGVFKFGANRSR